MPIAVPGQDQEERFEGILTRKHEWENTTKKASNRYVYIYQLPKYSRFSSNQSDLHREDLSLFFTFNFSIKEMLLY